LDRSCAGAGALWRQPEASRELQISGAIAAAPENAEPYALLADLWTQQRPDLAEMLQSGNSLSRVLLLSGATGEVRQYVG
jgi:hypothetical protein